MTERGLVASRSQAESFIKLGKVAVNRKITKRAAQKICSDDVIELLLDENYVSRAGLKLASVVEIFKVNFRNKVVLDIGSSTGGFTDYSLQHGAKKIYAVDVGTNQLHPSLRVKKQIKLYEKTDIRKVYSRAPLDKKDEFIVLGEFPQVILCDVSFISLRDILPHVAKNIMASETVLLAMVKPQFEAGAGQVNKGIIKNNAVRRQILVDFEMWAMNKFIVHCKRDSEVSGAKGNLERFYMLSLKH